MRTAVSPVIPSMTYQLMDGRHRESTGHVLAFEYPRLHRPRHIYLVPRRYFALKHRDISYHFVLLNIYYKNNSSPDSPQAINPLLS